MSGCDRAKQRLVASKLSVTIDSPGTAPGMQSIGVVWNHDALKHEIGPARTFLDLRLIASG